MSSEDQRDNRQQEPGRLVRPYYMTGGRTRPAHEDLELETLVATTALGATSTRVTGVERRAIVSLCRDLLSIAEVSARLDLPLGVARVLIGDMADQGFLILHRPTTVGDRPDLALLQRVLYGLQHRL
jgi:Protein of unknown function (DUF742)